jgi:hypothetical protein
LTFALALPAWFLTVWSFSPLDYRESLTGSDVSWTFRLDVPSWLFLESDLNVRSTGIERPTVVASVNGEEVARFRPSALFVGERSRTLIPFAVVKSGDNHLRLHTEGHQASFAMNLRLQNYRGINPRFPRAVVTADEAVADAHSQRGVLLRIADFILIAAALCGMVWCVQRVLSRRLAASPVVILGPSVVVLSAGAVYSLASPLHLWLLPESVATLVAAPALVTGALLALRFHRRVLFRVALSASVALALMEVGFRVLNRIAPTPIFYAETGARYRGQPGAPFLDTHLNSAGFNDVERRPRKPDAVHRIVAIGDSVTFGVVPRQHNYVALLEHELATHRPTEVVNMGVPGTAPNDYLAILVDEGLSYSPDLVMVGFFIGNDFESRARRWYEHSFAMTLVHFLWRLGTSAGEGATWIEATRGTYEDDVPTFGEERFLEIEVSRANIYVDDASLRDAAARAADYLGEMDDVTRRTGAEFVVVIIPDEVQVDSALQKLVTHAHGAPPERFDFDRPNRVLADHLSRRGIEFIDLTPAFREAARGQRLYKPQDTHWNIAGNRLAADVLARYLEERTR